MRMHCDVGLAGEERILYLLREKTFPLELLEAQVLDLVALCLDNLQLCFQADVRQESAHIFSLP